MLSIDLEFLTFVEEMPEYYSLLVEEMILGKKISVTILWEGHGWVESV